VDVAVMQSLFDGDDVKELVRNYGMVIVDECHHVSAVNFEKILRYVNAKYVYGLTATPIRQDGHHPIIFMQCGPIRYRVDAKEQAEKRMFEHYLIPRFTSFRNLSDEHIQKIITAILKQSICEDVHELFFEQSVQGLNVNFKKNSEIYNTGHISPILINSFISKLKSLSNLDPTISEIPQLGKLNFKVDDMNLIASISAFPTIQGERISLKIYKPPKKLNEICVDETMRNTIRNAFQTPGIVLVCGADLSGKTHLIYSILEDIQNPSKNIMTVESITKYNLTNISQCELNENIGFSLDKAMRFIEFQSPDIIYFEGINTSKSFEYFTTLVYKNKVLITEFLAENMADLRTKLLNTEYSSLKQLLSCIIFIHNKSSIEVFDKLNIEKYI
jgi:transcription-repair coupling factor (superfamily II helicase)